MAYNISVKFKDRPDRWRWVERGIELLRDQGLRYNPDDVFDLPQLAWFFQHKMGQNLDDANMYYKQQWAEEMTPFFGPNGTNFDALIHPQTAEDRTNALVLREKYKMDPVFAKRWTRNRARSTGGCRRRTRFTGPRSALKRRRKIPTR